MVNYTLDVEQARAYYDAESAIIFVHYRGTLTGDAAMMSTDGWKNYTMKSTWIICMA